MKLVRVLVYEGPEEWIDEMVAARAVKGKVNFVRPPKSIEETACLKLSQAAEVNMEIKMKVPHE